MLHPGAVLSLRFRVERRANGDASSVMTSAWNADGRGCWVCVLQMCAWRRRSRAELTQDKGGPWRSCHSEVGPPTSRALHIAERRPHVLMAVLRSDLAGPRPGRWPRPPLLPGRLGGRGDVLVEAEQVGWVVASFDRGQPI